MRPIGKKFRATLMKQDRYGRILNSVLFTGHNPLLTGLRTSICRTNPMTIFLKLNQFLRSYDPNEILTKAEDILGSKIVDYKKARRLREHERDKRNIIVWLLWRSESYTNRQIGEYIGLTQSSVSRRLDHKRRSIEAGKNKLIHQVKTIIKV